MENTINQHNIHSIISIAKNLRKLKMKRYKWSGKHIMITIEDVTQITNLCNLILSENEQTPEIEIIPQPPRIEPKPMVFDDETIKWANKVRKCGGHYHKEKPEETEEDKQLMAFADDLFGVDN